MISWWWLNAELLRHGGLKRAAGRSDNTLNYSYIHTYAGG